MTYPHQVVVDHAGKVVGRVAVILQDYLIVDLLVIKGDLAMDDVFEYCLTLGHLHPDYVRLTISFLLLDLIGR